MRPCMRGWAKRPKLLVRLLALLAVVMVMREWIWMPSLIVGDSMLPTLHSGDFVGINKLIYLFRLPRRQEVVAAWTGNELMIKRVLGLPGERVEVRDGVFYVDGLPLAEPYADRNEHSNIAPGRLGPNNYVLAGDNRRVSLVAIVSRNRIVGRVVAAGPPMKDASTRHYQRPPN